MMLYSHVLLNDIAKLSELLQKPRKDGKTGWENTGIKTFLQDQLFYYLYIWSRRHAHKMYLCHSQTITMYTFSEAFLQNETNTILHLPPTRKVSARVYKKVKPKNRPFMRHHRGKSEDAFLLFAHNWAKNHHTYEKGGNTKGKLDKVKRLVIYILGMKLSNKKVCVSE